MTRTFRQLTLVSLAAAAAGLGIFSSAASAETACFLDCRNNGWGPRQCARYCEAYRAEPQSFNRGTTTSRSYGPAYGYRSYSSGPVYGYRSSSAPAYGYTAYVGPVYGYTAYNTTMNRCSPLEDYVVGNGCVEPSPN